ncbi:MAG: leucine-rich repeat protein [Muribaculaceae bacterium]|nr:leucine-rich repeat protein [Muribaculaceae bacterium]
MRRLLFFAMIALLMAFHASSLTFNVSGLKYTTTSSGSYDVSVEGYTGSSSAILIPGTVTYAGVTYRVKYIGSWAFSSNVNIESVEISYGVTEIEENAFSGCTSLTYVRMPSSLTRIQSDAFSGCTAGLTVACAALTPPTCVDGPFDTARRTKLITPRPMGSESSGNTPVELYRADTDWKRFSTVTDKSSVAYDCVFNNGTSASYYIIKNNTSITINGTTYNGEAHLVAGGNQCKALDAITVNGKKYAVTAIRGYAFDTSYSSGNITILNGSCSNVKEIGKRAFYNSNVVSTPVCKVLYRIYDSAFENCSEFEGNPIERGPYNEIQLVLPPTLRYIGTKAFYGCTNRYKVSCYVRNPSLLTLGSNVFSLSKYGSGREMNIPYASSELYRATTGLLDCFNYTNPVLAKITIDGTPVTYSNCSNGAIVSGVSVDVDNNIVTLNNVNLLAANSNDTFIKYRDEINDNICGGDYELTIRLNGDNVVEPKGLFLEAEGSVLINGSGTGTLNVVCKYWNDAICAQGYVAASLTDWEFRLKDIANIYLFAPATNGQYGYFQAFDGSNNAHLVVENTNGVFENTLSKKVIDRVNSLTLVGVEMSDLDTGAVISPSSSSTFGNVAFDTPTAPLGNILIDGVRLTRANCHSGGIVNGVSASWGKQRKRVLITMDNVNYNKSSNNFMVINGGMTNIYLKGNNYVTASLFLRGNNGAEIHIDGKSNTGSLTTVGKSSGMSNFYFASGGGLCDIRDVKYLSNTATAYPFLGKTGVTTLCLYHSSGEFVRTTNSGVAIAQTKLNLVNTQLTNCAYSSSATQFGRDGKVIFEAVSGINGDIDGNGVLEVNDVVILAELAMSGGATAEQISVGDMDGSETIDVNDVVILAGLVMGN